MINITSCDVIGPFADLNVPTSPFAAHRPLFAFHDTSCQFGLAVAADRLELSSHSSVVVQELEDDSMNGIIYIVGLIVVIGVILSFFGLR